MKSPVVCLDFDGVVNDYPGWTFEGYNVIHGKPMPGIHEAVTKLRNAGIFVVVHSTRCSYPGGAAAIMAYVQGYNIPVDAICLHKPIADLYIDDNGLRFEGNWTKSVTEALSIINPGKAKEA